MSQKTLKSLRPKKLLRQGKKFTKKKGGTFLRAVSTKRTDYTVKLIHTAVIMMRVTRSHEFTASMDHYVISGQCFTFCDHTKGT